MKKFSKVIGVILVGLLLGVIACGQQPQQADAPEGGTASDTVAVQPAGPERSDSSAPSQEPAQAAAPVARDGLSAQPSVDKVGPADRSTSVGDTPEALAPQPFFLLITEPQHDTVVTDPSMRLSGRTGADAVVSINGVPAEVDGLGSFTTTAQLEPGPNIIDVVATSPEGEVISSVVAVIYRPAKTG